MIRYFIAMALAASTVASAGISCPPDWHGCGGAKCSTPGPGTSNSCESGGAGDPVMTQSGVSFHRVADLTSPGTVKPFVFYRSYSSTNDLNAYSAFLGGNAVDLVFVPKMFGTSRTNVNAANWTSSLMEGISVRATTNITYAVNSDQSIVRFQPYDPSNGTPAFGQKSYAPLYSSEKGYRGNLFFSGYQTDGGIFQDGGTYFVLWERGIGRTTFGAAYNRYRFFPTAFESDQHRGAGLTISYADAGAGCPLPGGNQSTPGAPYVKFVTTEDGTVYQYIWKMVERGNSASAIECVLSEIDVQDRNSGTWTQVVKYTYDVLSDGGQKGDYISQVEWPVEGRSETYSYPVNQFQWTRTGYNVSSTYSGSPAKAVSVSQFGETLALAYQDNPFCADIGCPNGCSATCAGQHGGTYADVVWTAGFGGFDGGTDIYTERFGFWSADNWYHGPTLVLKSHYDAGVSANLSAGEKQLRWEGNAGGELQPNWEKAVKDKRGNFTTFFQVARRDSGVGDPLTVPELSEVRWGAVDADGGKPMMAERYKYFYGSQGLTPHFSEQLPQSTETNSVFSAGNVATSKRWYDATTNILTKTTRKGYATDVTEAALARTVGTFNFTSRSCGGAAGPDALGRTLEVHGPCDISAETDTDCPSSPAYPVTVYEYYSAADLTPNNRNRLKKTYRYVNGSTDCGAGTPLTVTYAAYDAYGNAQTVTDENGNDTTYTFDSAGHVLSRTKSSQTTRFAYEQGELVRVMYPQGNGEVFCHRTGSNDDCTTGNFEPRVQWTAKKACTGTTSFSCTGNWAERINYTYRLDGTLAREEYRTCESGSCSTASNGVIRRVAKYSRDALKRNTWRGFGDAVGQYSSMSFFDRADNPAGISQTFNSAPDFCGGPDTAGGKPDEPVSKLCSHMRYDRANRMSEMTQYPTGSGSGQTTCFGYDGVGNVTAVTPGCTTSCNSDANGVPLGTCSGGTTAQTSEYKWDDFGNVAFADLPWTNNGAGAKGRWTFQYDAMNNLIMRRSPHQHAGGGGTWKTTFTYDGLGRNTLAQAWSPGSSTLWSFVYDSASSPTNCPTPLTNQKARVAKRTDSYGDTYYSYDAEGRVLKEVRLKVGGGATCQVGGSLLYNPHTTYSYTANGNLSGITQPHGRGVQYVYGSAGFTDRVASINIDRRESGAWVSKTGVINNVFWEPYGGLRRYQVSPPGGASPALTVEYRQGDNKEAAPISSFCTAAWTPGADDYTGRLRALWVTSGNAALGSGTGNIYRRWYRWRGDVPVEADSCLLQESTPRTEVFGYDALPQLTMADGGYPSGPHGRVGYAYDARGNRTSMSEAGASSLTTTYTVSSTTDLLSALSRNDTGTMTRTFAWDKDGRSSSVSFGPNSTGQDSYTFGNFNGEQVTFRTASVGGATYTYLIDALNRRSVKQYPSGAEDVFFYDLGHQMLADIGVDDIVTPTGYPVDDYVWLGGRAVALVHGALDSTRAWRDDTTATSTQCKRNGVNTACGFYFPVTDHIGSPVLMLDSSARVTGTSEADAFGYPNRGTVSATTGTQPYSANQNLVLGSFQIANAASATTTEARVKFSVFETEATNDFVRIEESGGATGANVSGAKNGPTWTSWLTLTSVGATKTLNVRFVSNATTQSAGVIAEAFEYRRYQSAVSTPFFTSLRFPGQYHDAETDTFENWNRNYDPFIGRYLQSDPVLSAPSWPAAYAMGGYSMPVYSYVANNPISFIDPNGLHHKCDTGWCADWWDPMDMFGDPPKPKDKQKSICPLPSAEASGGGDKKDGDGKGDKKDDKGDKSRPYRDPIPPLATPPNPPLPKATPLPNLPRLPPGVKWK